MNWGEGLGIWAFILALVWAYGIEKKSGKTVSFGTIWERIPKFVIGYFVTFLVMLLLALRLPTLLGAVKVATAESNIFRVLFFGDSSWQHKRSNRKSPTR